MLGLAMEFALDTGMEPTCKPMSFQVICYYIDIMAIPDEYTPFYQEG
jgi:hypothetical protein